MLPVALETYGRMGRKSLGTVNFLANQLVSGTVASRFHCTADLVAALRYELELALLWNIADITLLSVGHHSQVWRRCGAGVLD